VISFFSCKDLIAIVSSGTQRRSGAQDTALQTGITDSPPQGSVSLRFIGALHSTYVPGTATEEYSSVCMTK